MTNGEKFVTAEERHKVFRTFCESHISCAVCILNRIVTDKNISCQFRWLDLEEGTDEDEEVNND